MITHTLVRNITGPKTYLLKDEEAYIVEISEIDGTRLLPRDTTSPANKLQQVIHDVGKWIIGNITKHKSAQRYAHRVIEWVNKEEGKTEGRKRKTKTGMIKVSDLIHKRENKSDPRIACIMFQYIYLAYQDTKNK